MVDEARRYREQDYGFTEPPPIPANDPHTVLGLPRSATRPEINRRHRQLARENRDDDAKLRQINQAYNTLKG